jgi:hypothetical protein
MSVMGTVGPANRTVHLALRFGAQDGVAVSLQRVSGVLNGLTGRRRCIQTSALAQWTPLGTSYLMRGREETQRAALLIDRGMPERCAILRRPGIVQRVTAFMCSFRR